jgi:hypothetical protein
MELRSLNMQSYAREYAQEKRYFEEEVGQGYAPDYDHERISRLEKKVAKARMETEQWKA